MPRKPTTISPTIARLEDDVIRKTTPRVPAIVGDELDVQQLYREAQELQGATLDQLEAVLPHYRQRSLASQILIGSVLIAAKRFAPPRAHTSWIRAQGISLSTGYYYIHLAQAFFEYMDHQSEKVPSLETLSHRTTANELLDMAHSISHKPSEKHTTVPSRGTSDPVILDNDVIRQPEEEPILLPQPVVEHVCCEHVATLQVFIRELERERDEARAELRARAPQLPLPGTSSQSNVMRGEPTPKDYSARRPRRQH